MTRHFSPGCSASDCKFDVKTSTATVLHGCDAFVSLAFSSMNAAAVEFVTH